MIQSTDNLETANYSHQFTGILLKLSNLKEENSTDCNEKRNDNECKSSTSKLTDKTIVKLNDKLNVKTGEKSTNKLISKSSIKLNGNLNCKTNKKLKDKKLKDKKDNIPNNQISNRKRSDIENIFDLKLLKRAKSDQMGDQRKILVFCGPSGSGKSTLLKKLRAEFPNYFGFSISHTTRGPRAGEIHGQDYYYVSREEMLKAIENNEFIETTEFSNNIYGTSKKAVKDVISKDKICILDIEIEGVKNVKKSDLEAVYIFIKPPTIDELERRLRKRGSETEENIQKRLQRAKDEIAFGDIDENFDLLLVNDNFDDTYKKLKTFVLNYYNLVDTSYEEDVNEEEKQEILNSS